MKLKLFAVISIICLLSAVPSFLILKSKTSDTRGNESAETTVLTSSTATTTTTTTTVTETTTATTPITTTAATLSQVDLYRHIYGSWLESALEAVDNRAGLMFEEDNTLSFIIGYLNESTLATASGVGEEIFVIKFNKNYVDYDTIIDNIDGLTPEFSDTMSMDTVFTHEMTHILCYMNIPYTTLSTVPKWYMEGLAEAVVGNDSFYDYPPNDSYDVKDENGDAITVQGWEITRSMIIMLNDRTEDFSVYCAGYLICHWLDNYGANGGNIKKLNTNLKKGQSFSEACKNVYGKTSAVLLAEFQLASAAINSYDDWVRWLDSDMNIQCGDGLLDSLCNNDAALTDIIPNTREPKDVSKSDVVEYRGVNITLQWVFKK